MLCVRRWFLALAAALLALTTVPAAASAAMSFTPSTGSPFAVGGQPSSVAEGDFNDDGNVDLVIATPGTTTLTVLLGDGTGGFSPAAGSPFDVGTNPTQVVVADFNGDGDADVAVGTQINSVVVLLGDGSAGFTAAAGSPFFVGALGPQSLVANDFNGDGNVDFATGNINSNSVSVMLGNGSGGFSAAPGSPFATGGSFVNRVATADFNGDGKPDVAAINEGSDDVSVLLGNGSGGLSAAAGSPISLGAGASPRGITAGDVNRDGKSDLAVANGNASTVAVLLGDGTGGFAGGPGSPISTGSFSNPYSIAAGELDGDGNPDLAAGRLSQGTVAGLDGDGAGGFSLDPGSFGIGTVPLSIAVGDLNHDGKPDLAVTGQVSNNLTVLLNTATYAPPAAGSVLVDELRFTGPNGAGDQYVKLFNPSTSPREVGGWTLAGSNGQSVLIPQATVIPPLGYVLLTGPWNSGSGYSLNDYGPSTLELPYGSGGSLAIPQATGGVKLLSPFGTTIDAAGFAGAPSGYFEGTALPQPPAFSGDQEAWTRRVSGGAPVDTGDNASDFVQVDAGSGAGDPSFGSPIGGAPSPAGLQSPTVHNDILQSSLIDPGVPANASPNQIKSGGFVIFNRTLTNCSGQPTTGVCANANPGAARTVTRLRFRIADLTTDGNSPDIGQAILRGTDVPAQTNLPVSGGGTADVPAMTLDVPPSATDRGGIGSSWTATANLPGGGLAAGASVNVGFRFQIVRAGGFTFAYQAEDDLVSAKETRSSPPPAQAESPAGAKPVAPAVSGTLAPGPGSGSSGAASAPAPGAPVGSTPAKAKKRCTRTTTKRKRSTRCSVKKKPKAKKKPRHRKRARR